MAFELMYKPFGVNSILVEWPPKIDATVLNDILSFKRKLEKDKEHKNFSFVQAYASILITYQESKGFSFTTEVKYLKKVYSRLDKISFKSNTLWKIPVCYHSDFGIDLRELSKAKEISVETIIAQHSQPLYTIYFIGFLPGFLYLGGLHEILHTPRKATPRLKIPKGAVAIGSKQTGIYPDESPGGWHIIGNSPINFFDVSKPKPCFAKVGDSVQFYPVSHEKYVEIKILVDAGVYQMESEVLDG